MHDLDRVPLGCVDDVRRTELGHEREHLVVDVDGNQRIRGLRRATLEHRQSTATASDHDGSRTDRHLNGVHRGAEARRDSAAQTSAATQRLRVAEGTDQDEQRLQSAVSRPVGIDGLDVTGVLAVGRQFEIAVALAVVSAFCRWRGQVSRRRC